MLILIIINGTGMHNLPRGRRFKMEPAVEMWSFTLLNYWIAAWVAHGGVRLLKLAYFASHS